MYDYSGEWGYSIGIPAKSGVSGLIYAVIPGVCGIAIYSPKLDKIGNSYRGIQFYRRMSEIFNIHIFDNQYNSKKANIIKHDYHDKTILGFLLLDACKKNVISTIHEVLSKGCDINFADYDRRTALHIACSENNVNIIKLLLEKGIKVEKDRWGNLPFDELSEDTRKELDL